MHITDVVLEPGEKSSASPPRGDVVRWVLALGKSVAEGAEQWHVYLKPTRPDLETNLAINTDRRTYLLELHSYPETYMAAVTWRYPQDELARLQLQADAAATQERSIVARRQPRRAQLQLRDPRHERLSPSGRRCRCSTTDAARSFAFPQRCSCARRPRSSSCATSETQLVNYRMKGDTYVVDRLLDAAELRVGSKDQEIVRVERARKR